MQVQILRMTLLPDPRIEDHTGCGDGGFLWDASRFFCPAGGVPVTVAVDVLVTVEIKVVGVLAVSIWVVGEAVSVSDSGGAVKVVVVVAIAVDTVAVVAAVLRVVVRVTVVVVGARGYFEVQYDYAGGNPFTMLANAATSLGQVPALTKRPH